MPAFQGRSSLVRLSLLALLVFFISAILVVVALAGVRSSSDEAVSAWRRFADQASTEQRTLRNYITLSGMGGFIDDYGRLVATGDESLAGLVYAKAGAAIASIGAYPLDHATEAQKKAQAALQTNLRAYLGRVAPILAMHRAGRPVAEIAKFAHVSDDQAAAALKTLVEAVTAADATDRTAPVPKAITLLDMRRALGVEGLTQHVDAWLANRDPQELARVGGALTQVRASIAKYRLHVLLPAESAALDRFERELAAVEASLSSSQAKHLDTAPLQRALVELEALVYSEATAAQNNLQKTLADVSSRAETIIALVAIGAVFLLAGSVWLLVFRIGRRIKAITVTMRAMASGKLDVEIPSSKDRDEIGEMSRALLVFRDGLRANATMTQELAESSRLASLGAMVAGMAHELNTPLGNALAVSSTLEDQCKAFRKDLSSERILRSVLDRHAASLEDAAALIQRNLLRASEQIGSFKEVAVDQTSGQRREFQLDDVLANVVLTLTPLFKRTPFKLVLGEPQGAVMDSYPGALSQVVTNLVENGLKHGLVGRPEGEVKVSVRRLGPHVTEIVVADDGAGIPDDVKPSLFRAFFTTKAGKGGSGLGLHIVKSIVSGPLGGQISVQSNAGQGARFVLTLPNKAPVATAPDTKDMERVYYAAGKAA